MRTLAIVPARSGSKGIPGKNVRLFRGKPLLAWAVEIGKQTCDDVVCTTDSTEYGILACQYGAHVVLRPKELAQDDTPMLLVIQHAMKGFPEADVIVILQPTQPFRTKAHVLEALRILEREEEYTSVISLVEIPGHYSPVAALRINHPMLPCARVEPFIDPGVEYVLDASFLRPTYGLDAMPTNRQELRRAYSRDGTVYVARRSTINGRSLYGASCQPLVIPHSESVNLDTEEDWAEAEARA